MNRINDTSTTKSVLARLRERTLCGHCRTGAHCKGHGVCHAVFDHLIYPFMRALTAEVILRPSALPPITATISLAVSFATSTTASMAPARISAIACSLSATFAAISASASAIATSRSAWIAALVSEAILVLLREHQQALCHRQPLPLRLWT